MTIPKDSKAISIAIAIKGALYIFAVQVILLLGSDPMVDLDTNSYIQGGFSWDIYHNPFENMYLAFILKIGGGALLAAIGQLLVFAASASFLSRVLFPDNRFLFYLICSIAAFEPIGLFFHFSILPESFFISFLLLSIGFALLWLREKEKRFSFFSGLFLGAMFLCKVSGLFFLPALALFIQKKERRYFFGDFIRAALPVVFALSFVIIGQYRLHGDVFFLHSGRFQFDRLSMHYQTASNLPNSKWIDAALYDSLNWKRNSDVRRIQMQEGWKACIAEQENNKSGHSATVFYCDEIWLKSAQELRKKGPSGQFSENFSNLHRQNYLDERLTPGLEWRHDPKEFEALDEKMQTHFGSFKGPLSTPAFSGWRKIAFLNVYIPILFWLFIGLCLFTFLYVLRKSKKPELGLVFLFFILPYFAMVLYIIPWRTRFFAPLILPILIYSVVSIYIGIEEMTKRNKEIQKQNPAAIPPEG